MANSVPTTERDEQWMKEGGHLTKLTLQDRARDFKYFETYLATQTRTPSRTCSRTSRRRRSSRIISFGSSSVSVWVRTTR